MLSPTVVGQLVSAFTHICVIPFNRGYGGTIKVWQTVLRTMPGFFGGLLLVILPFGLLSTLVTPLMRKNRSR